MAEISILNTDDLRKMKDSEGLILQGCGGDLNKWVDGINDLLTKEGILLEGTKFTEVSAFKYHDLTNLLFKFTDDVQLSVGKLAIWRLASHETFGGTWLSDYVDNNLGGFAMSDFEKQIRELNTFADTESSYDFQCNATGGWPTSLTWNHAEGKAWLAPNDSMDCDSAHFETAMKACERFGIRTCESVEDFNAILDSLGEDARQCKLYEENEEQDLC